MLTCRVCYQQSGSFSHIIAITGFFIVTLCLVGCFHSKPEVYTGEKALSSIRGRELSPSTTASNPYYFISGFQDAMIYAAYSDNLESLKGEFKRISGVSLEKADKWHGQDEWMLDGPGVVDPKYKTILYDLSKVTDAVYFNRRENGEDISLVLDIKNQRLYYYYFNM